MTRRKKLIEGALPLEAINVASAREKSIRHGHPSTLHLVQSFPELERLAKEPGQRTTAQPSMLVEDEDVG